jgi:hypothetical protein
MVQLAIKKAAAPDGELKVKDLWPLAGRRKKEMRVERKSRNFEQQF